MSATTYPRVYRFSGLVLAAWLILELALLGGGVATIVFSSLIFGKAALLGRICGVLLVAIGLPAFVSTMRGKLVLFADRAEYTGILGTRVMYTAGVRETRAAKRQYGHGVVTIVLKNGRKVQICDFGQMDEALAEWINSFPNAEDKAKELRDDRLMANPAFGGNPAAREQAINADAALFSRLGWPCYAIILWGMAYPRPYTTCLSILMVLPLLALIAAGASRGRWTLLEEGRSGKLGIGQRLFIGPSIVLALRAFLDDYAVDWVVPVLWAIGAGLLVGLLSVVIERQKSGKAFVGFWLVWAVYAWGGLMYVDTTFDPAPGQPVAVRVIDMKEGQHSQTLNLSHWGAHKDGDEVSVSGNVYSTVHKGDTVCVFIHPGVLGFAWYEVGHCPPQH